MAKKRKRRARLPRKLLFIPSSDKDFIETWGQKGGNPDPLNLPASWRMCIMGTVGVGKTNFIKNVIIRAKPPFERIFVLHNDPLAQEYNDIDAETLTELPDNDFWLGYNQKDENGEPIVEDLEDTVRPKSLIILDDICFAELSKQQTNRLDRLVCSISSHANVSVCCINQDWFSCNPIIKKTGNIFVIYRPHCTDELSTIARRVGMSGRELKFLFDNIATKDSDNIMIDKTPQTPYPLRLNGFNIISAKAKDMI